MYRRRVCSLLRAKREPERTAVPAGHESPSGAFKPQTGLQSKCRVFSAARSLLLSRRGRRRVAAPCVCFVPWTALASCRPLPQQLLPAFPLLSLCDIFPRPGEVFGRRPQSSPLQYQRKYYFYICKLEKSADFSNLLFHGRGRNS